MRFTAKAIPLFLLLMGALSAHSTDGPNPAFGRTHATAIIGSWLLNFDYTDVTRYDCAICMFEGRYDLTTPSQVTTDWFKRVPAPKKGFVWFENSAHMIEVEEPGRVLLHLVQDVRPLAEKGVR